MRIRAASLNYRDLMMARGEYGGPLAKDLVPLADGAGEVTSVGPGVTRWKVGDRVCLAYFPTWQAGPFHVKTHAEALGQTSVHGDARMAARDPSPDGRRGRRSDHRDRRRRHASSLDRRGRISLVGMLTGFDGRIDPVPVLVRNIHLEGTIVGSASAALAKLESGSHFGKLVIRI